jgi:hypothetical protein
VSYPTRSGLLERRRLGLVAVTSFPEQWLSVRVAHSGPSAAANGKMGSPQHGEGPHSGDRTREALVRGGGRASTSLG